MVGGILFHEHNLSLNLMLGQKAESWGISDIWTHIIYMMLTFDDKELKDIVFVCLI